VDNEVDKSGQQEVSAPDSERERERERERDATSCVVICASLQCTVFMANLATLHGVDNEWSAQ
jgi:hypothetical protein